MPEIRTLIVDDEPLARRGIRQLLSPYPDLVVVGECRDGREAVRALTTLEPDLVFLDVQMPGLDGLGVVRVHGAERMPVTVFVTAHDEFAVQAFEAQALDYLVKPISESRFRATVSRVRERLRVNDALTLASRLSALLEGPVGGAAGTDSVGDAALDSGPSIRRTSGGRLAVPTETGELLLDADEIDWLEAPAPAGRGQSLAIREPPDGQSTGARRVRLEPAPPVRCVDPGDRDPLYRMQMVRRSEIEAEGLVAELSAASCAAGFGCLVGEACAIHCCLALLTVADTIVIRIIVNRA